MLIKNKVNSHKYYKGKDLIKSSMYWNEAKPLIFDIYKFHNKERRITHKGLYAPEMLPIQVL